MRDGRPELFRLPELNFIDDKAGKPVGINEFIGRRPIAAFGNSDGDIEMLQWTTMSGGVRLGLFVHHTDAEREYAYDRDTPFGRLDKGLDAAAVNKWAVVDMKNDSGSVSSLSSNTPSATMSAQGLGCVKTQTRSVAAEETSSKSPIVEQTFPSEFRF